MNSALEKLSGPGKSLRSEPPDAKEFTGLKRSVHARLADAVRTDNSLESRFDLAYNAAHSFCLFPCYWNECTLEPTLRHRREG